jgi:hypothetical protein
MKATALFALAPLGALVSFSDGTPRPPDRFNKKLSAWKSRNAKGIFVKADPADPKWDWSKDSITIRTSESDYLVVNMTFSTTDDKDYTIEAMPKPWTILAYSDFDGRREIAHIWENERHARDWFQRNRYEPHKYGRKHLIVNETGTLIPFQFAEERDAEAA